MWDLIMHVGIVIGILYFFNVFDSQAEKNKRNALRAARDL